MSSWPGLPLWAKSSWKPIVAGAVMSCVFLALPNVVPWQTATIAGATYLAVMAVLLLVSHGGSDASRASFWALWMK